MKRLFFFSFIISFSLCSTSCEQDDDVVPATITADFTANQFVLAEGDSIAFTDLSTGDPTSWSWTFAGGEPASSTEQNPTVTYAVAGTYEVSLTVINGNAEDTEVKVGYITVTENPTPLFLDPVIAQEDVVLTSDVWYGEGEEEPGGAGTFYLDIYRPSNYPLPDKLPAIIYLHGGNGNKEAQPAPSYCYEFARRGYVAIAVQYRVGNVTTAAGDVANAIRWVRENAASYKVDTDRILVGGHSFGGVTSAELTANQSNYFGAGEGSFAATLLCAAALNQFPVNTSEISLGYPPIMIVHGLNDPIATVDGIRSLVTDLDNLTDPVNGTRYPYSYLEVAGAGHAFYPGTGSGVTIPLIAGPIDATQGWSNTEIAGKAVADHVFEFFFEHLNLNDI